MNLSERFDEAIIFAARLHREQLRNGTEIPYLSHLMATAALVLEHGGDEDEATRLRHFKPDFGPFSSLIPF